VRCMKCSDKVITLVPQIYRRVDYVEFDSKEDVSTFIGKWRSTGKQIMGLLVGRYLPYQNKDNYSKKDSERKDSEKKDSERKDSEKKDSEKKDSEKKVYDLPDGVKARVSGIWEIAQERFPDGVVPVCIPKSFFCDDLEILGVIYTDLVVRDNEVVNYKKLGDYVISTVEMNFFYALQSHIKNPRFINVCLSEDENHNVVPECYMIGDQYRALMEADALELTTDPRLYETGREIVYMERNEYGKDVRHGSDSYVPVDYFVVTCEIGWKEDPLFPDKTAFDKMNLRKLGEYFNGDFSFPKFKNFQVLVGISGILKDASRLLSAVIKGDEKAFERLRIEPEIVELVGKLDGYATTVWNCPECTFENKGKSTECEMCKTQRE